MALESKLDSASPVTRRVTVDTLIRGGEAVLGFVQAGPLPPRQHCWWKSKGHGLIITRAKRELTYLGAFFDEKGQPRKLGSLQIKSEIVERDHRFLYRPHRKRGPLGTYLVGNLRYGRQFLKKAALVEELVRRRLENPLDLFEPILRRALHTLRPDGTRRSWYNFLWYHMRRWTKSNKAHVKLGTESVGDRSGCIVR